MSRRHTLMNLPIFAGFLSGLAGCAGPEPLVERGSPDAQAGEASIMDAWSRDAFAAIAASEYAPRADGDAVLAVNRSQGLRARFRDGAVVVADRRDASVSVELRLAAWGREGILQVADAALAEEGDCASSASRTVEGDCVRRVAFARPGLLEWWENRAEGLEQGFVVTAPPDGEGALVFELSVEGARVERDGDVLLLARAGAEPLRYEGLAAWDATGRALPTWMDTTGEGIRIWVDDEGAIGDVTVDPVLSTGSWRQEGNQTTANYGFAVSHAGDVNGDGFGDVVIGARTYDNGQTDEGKAWVFHGSASGLALTPAWQMEPDQAGAFYGVAVAAAGDVNGDGYGDVLVGARNYANGHSAEGTAWLYAGSATGLGLTAAWVGEANQSSAHFGEALASAGDVNGDGYADVIIGARDYDNGSTNEGRAYVYMGSATGLGTTATWMMEPDQAQAAMGSAVAGLGDVNGDGYDDVAVGTPGYDNGHTDEGMVTVYLGSASGLTTTVAWTGEGNQTSAAYGNAIAGAGDVDGDGMSELLVGCASCDNGETDEGRAFLFRGTTSGPSGTAAWNLEPNQASASLGYAVASAGDVNGDGYGDVIVGAPNLDNGQTDEGRVQVFLGSASGLQTSAIWSGEPNQVGASFGAAVASGGDVNGDGRGDVIVGAPNYDNGQTDEGGAFVFLGASTGLGTSAAWTGSGEQAGASFGTALASAGDVNGDGHADVLVGAPSHDGGETDEGRAYVFLGSTSGFGATAAWTFESDLAGANLGAAVSSAGDVNGDGYGDLVLGAPLATGGGRAYVFLGSAAGPTSTASWTADVGQSGARFGVAVAGAGDVDGDGFGDVLVGADGYDDTYAGEGAAFLFRGSGTGLASSATWTMKGGQTGAAFGAALAGAGDVDANGYADVLIGAPNHDDGQADEGIARLYLGASTGLAASAAWSAQSDQAGAAFGASVASAGDVNGDGYNDVLVGAYAFDNGSTDEGRATLYLGGASGLATSSAWTAESDQAAADFGYSLGSAGDVNGDGYGDVVVGAPRYDNGSTDEGRVSVYLGGASGLATSATWTTETNQAGAQLGWSVASAGDVDGDGFGDVIFGAPGQDSSLADAGAVLGHLGNAGDGTTGRARVATARRPGTSVLVAPGLAPTSASAFDVNLAHAAGASGRGRVKAQVEVKPVGTAFSGAGTLVSTAWVDSGLAGVSLDQAVTSLTAGTGYHWRARVRVSPAHGRPELWGPWLYGGTSGMSAGAHVYTAGATFYADADGDGFGRDDLTLVVRGGSVTGYASVGGDCDDVNATVNPSAAEVCDAADDDEDCDGAADDADASVALAGMSTSYVDADGDGFGGSSSVRTCDLPAGNVLTSTDCVDTDANVHPGATDVDADGVDSDCDGDETCHADADGDGYRTGALAVQTGAPGRSGACGAVGLATSTVPGGDCDDRTAAIHPGAAEVCDAANTDEDCDGTADDADSSVATAGKVTSYADVDGDGRGGPSATLSCDVPAGNVTTSTDCADGDASIYPGATEVDADGTDSDCDGGERCYADADGDGYRTSALARVTSATGATAVCDASGYAPSTLPTGDCNDAAAAIHPGAAEVCDAANTDEDCDGVADDADASVVTSGRSTFYVDADGDGFGSTTPTLACDVPAGSVATSTDCADSNASVHPGAAETDADGTDSDCDGVERCYADADGDGFRTTTLLTRSVSPGASGSCAATGYATASAPSGDCADTIASVNPGAAEVCDAADVDEDCDGVSDDADTSVVTATRITTYADVDHDGYGGSAATTACDAPVGNVATSTDCLDSDAAVNPGASEVDADGVDADCDGSETCYADADGDGFRTDALSARSVVPGALHACDGVGLAPATVTAGDCDDAVATVNPGATEVCDTLDVDEDCDGAADDSDASTLVAGKRATYADVDGDGFGAGTALSRCDVSSGSVLTSSDCADDDAGVRPGATELAGDEVDQNCDGAETCFADADGDGARSAFSVASLDVDCADAGEASAGADLDCDDADADAFPGASDPVGSGVDENCDGAETCYVDADGDGYRVDGRTVTSTDGACGAAGETLATAPSGDCDDGDAAFHPFAPELDCTDTRDLNCDGSVVSADADGDGFAACEDCDDRDPSVHPGAVEVPGDLVDGDCDGGEACFVDADDDGVRAGTATVSSTRLACDGAGEALADAPTGDCDDADGDVYPGAVEVPGDLVDGDCDRVETCFADDDGDGARSGDLLEGAGLLCDGAGEAAADAALDCDDAAAAVAPGAAERVGDGVDEDCDGAERCYEDADGDGFRSATEVVSLDADCADPGEALASLPAGDCAPADALVSPAATELAGDGVDGDCDGVELCLVDEDGDGYVVDGTRVVVSTRVTCDGYGEALATAPVGDCDDTDAAFHPYAAESDCADPADYNCDGSTGAVDADGDGIFACEECDDADADVYPGAADATGDGVDSDCDGVELCFVDADADGYVGDALAMVVGVDLTCAARGEATESAPLGDCDDADADVSPAAAERVGDGVDGDCDGEELCYVDVDGDGYRVVDGATLTSVRLGCDGAGEADAAAPTGDCDDADATRHPGVAEVDCADPVDYNCDGSSGAADADGDGFLACEECDDARAATNPDASEVCNGADDDCDGGVDVGAFDAASWLSDVDGDGYGDTAAAVASCDLPEGYVSAARVDCDDVDAGVFPGADEIPDDGVDQDCDGADATGGGDTGVVDTGDTGTVDTGVVDTGDTGVVDTGDTGSVDTSDTGVVDTGDTGTVDTGDTGVVDTGDTGTVDTGDSGAVDTGTDVVSDDDTDASKPPGGCGCVSSTGGGVGAFGVAGLMVAVMTSRRRSRRSEG